MQCYWMKESLRIGILGGDADRFRWFFFFLESLVPSRSASKLVVLMPSEWTTLVEMLRLGARKHVSLASVAFVTTRKRSQECLRI
mmetsp:Transcript_45833/g.111064  ORF Transcript_45833/g.111064 Transcript_45833/m.111064 type:complete len:85 (-) Transcript_45833:445-699(-)